MLHKLSFSKKFICILGGVSILSVIGIGTISYFLIQTYIENTINSDLAQLTESAYHLVETSVDTSIRNYLRGIAEQHRELLLYYHTKVERRELTEEQARNAIKEFTLLPKIGKTGYLAFLDSKGVATIHPNQALVGTDITRFDFVKEAITKKEGYLEYLWKNPGDDKERAKAAYITYFEPWDDIIFASSYKSEFNTLVNVQDFRQKILAITIGKTGYAYIMDSRGNLIIHPALEGQNIYDMQDSQGRYFIREICAQKNGQLPYPWQNPGEPKPREKRVYFKYYEAMDWIIACGVYVDELYQPVNDLIYRLIAFSVGILLLVIALSFVFGRSLARPIKRLQGFAEQISKGDVTVKLPVTGQDEIGQLSVTFNAMSENLNAFIGQVQRSGIQITSSATELSATSRQQEATMATQVESTRHVLQSVEEIADVTDGLVHTIQEVTDVSEETSSISHERTDLARMGEAMRNMENASKAISDRLSAINEKTENITTVVTTITKVAEQTNLLSLNAAIEAEKAGEFGRGFTVVAREIRRLADQTAVATLDIERMVKEMQSAVASGVMEMDKFIAEVRHSVEDVGKISAKLAVIIRQVQDVAPNFESVNVAMAHLSEETQQTKDALHETYGAIEQLNEAARGLQDHVSRFKVS